MLNKNEKFRIPIFTSFAVFFCFFAATHILKFSIIIDDPDWRDQSIIFVEEGGAKRRAAFLILGVFACVLLLKKARYRLRMQGAFAFFIGAYLTWSLASFLWAVNRPLTMRRLVVFLIICLAAAAMVRRHGPREIIGLMFGVSFLFVTTGLISEVVLGTFRPLSLGYQFVGTTHPNQQGPLCVMLMISSWVLSKSGTRFSRLFGAVAGIAFLCLIMTGSRTAVAAGVVAFWSLWSLLSEGSRRRFVIVSLLTMFGIVFVLFSEAIFPAAKEIVFLGRYDETASTLTGRIPLWNECFDYVSRRPFVGYGFGGFWDPIRVEEISRSQYWEITSAHSTFVDVLLTLGSIGLCLFVFSFAAGLVKSRALWSRERGVEYAGLWAFLVFCFFEGILESILVDPVIVSYFFYLVIGCLAFISHGGELKRMGEMDRESGVGDVVSGQDGVFIGRSGRV